jgi:signal peptidase I
MKRWLFLLALGVAGAWVFRTYCYEGIYIASASMEPTLPVGQHVMMNKLRTRTHKPERGDIIVFESPVDASKGLVKRVIAVGGETIEMNKKRVIVDGHALDEPYTQYLKPDDVFVGDTFSPMRVPEGTVFVLGDNRDVSGDSRDWKNAEGERIPFVPIQKITGYIQQ